MRYGAVALKCGHSPAESHRSWVSSVAFSEVVLAFPRGCFEMQAQPFKVPQNPGMLCWTLRGYAINTTITKNPPRRITSSLRRLALLSAVSLPQLGPGWDSARGWRRLDMKQHESNMPTYRTPMSGLSPLHWIRHPTILMPNTTVLSPKLAPMGQLLRLPRRPRATTSTHHQHHRLLCCMAKVAPLNRT